MPSGYTTGLDTIVALSFPYTCDSFDVEVLMA